MLWNKELFPSFRLVLLDYLIGGAFLVFCYFAFFQVDITITGWNSLNYLFGNPLDFYENCKKFQGAGKFASANYPPSIYVVFAAWLYPLKLLGLIKSPAYFSPYWVYWLKILTSLVYVATGFVFYQVMQYYHCNKACGKYAAWLWLTTPLALFSQFIFSQYDIFYVFLTVAGFLFFIKRRIFLASFLFGVAITFKYFPLFVFVPLLVLCEKKITRLIFAGSIFFIPTVLIQCLYGNSPAFIEGVVHFSVLSRVFLASINVGGPTSIYYLVLLYTVLVGIAYSIKVYTLEIMAYIFLVTSVLPFLLIFWHPQWLLFATPAIVLTTVICHDRDKINKFLLFDLVAMLFFIAYVVIMFQDNVDLAMLQTSIFHIPVTNHYKMANLFKKVSGFGPNSYFSIFSGYLLLQIILKYPRILKEKSQYPLSYPYNDIRIRYYSGLLVFIIPLMVVIYKNYI
jgi:hypothetical protein